MNIILFSRKTAAAALLAFLTNAPAASQTIPDLLPSGKDLNGWLMTGSPERYKKESLFGYIDGGAEIFLQYGFRELAIGRYSTAGGDKSKEITAEIYLMESPACAFGIFSVKRAGDETASNALPLPNWTSVEQTHLAKSSYFINVTGAGCEKTDLERFAGLIAARIPAVPSVAPQISMLPEQNRLSGTERFIRGDLAAASESPLLSEDWWGFKSGTNAVSALYGKSRARLVILDFGREREPLLSSVELLFKEYLEDVKAGDGVVEGKNAAERHFLFRQSGRWAAIVLGCNDAKAGRVLLTAALEKIGGAGQERRPSGCQSKTPLIGGKTLIARANSCAEFASSGQ